VSDREGNELHPFPIFIEHRDKERVVFLGLLRESDVATEVPAEANLDDDIGATCFLLKEIGFGEGEFGTPLA
jgi:hypothetical protein